MSSLLRLPRRPTFVRLFAYDDGMELPEGFAERVDRLRDPQRFVASMVAALEDAERVDVNETSSEAPRRILDGLPPDARRQYVQIVNPDLAKIIDRRPSPEQQAFKRRLEERLRWLHSDDPAALARREELRREHELQVAKIRAEEKVKREETEAGLREAGLPVIPDLIDWLLDFPNLHLRGSVASGST